MQKLIEANLYQSELIPISGKLVERYNKCLVKLGFEETKLTSFSIDGKGWSPEIAQEKEHIHYLNHGDANPHGIIITPLQKGKPVYLPYHTFDREMMKFIFNSYETKINDITRDCAICLDFNQHIDAFYEPLDVLKYQSVTINFHLINELYSKQKEQLELIEKFRKDNNFIDEDLQQQLLDSAKTYGDLRHRDLELLAIFFQTDSFYTRALGGIYVLRNFISDIVVFEDIKTYKQAIKDTIHDVLIYHIEQPELMKKLRDHLIIECELKAMLNTTQYQRVKKMMLFQELKETKHPIVDILDDEVLFRKYLNAIDAEAIKRVNGVEIYLERIARSNAFKIPDLVEQKFYDALHKPHSSLHARHQDLIWKLLVNVSAKDVLFLYWYDKEQFYKTYETWPDTMKDWVIKTIRNNI
ncbi:DUF6638 family protein [Oceanihabitans sediminis]|uniref:DUF6638 family protein n=1 Tax=Oceanihabitans sediminis TaxID=1812012 RepID=UPI00299D9A1C|nr:DUF6638 family protein [Oceanihabitans sediminis]MDX1773415.1 DUF6638 family protein [Oceanihabitans sediminis]